MGSVKGYAVIFAKNINNEYHKFNNEKGPLLNARDFNFVKTRDTFSRAKMYQGRKYRQTCNTDGMNKKKATHIGLIDKTYEWED